MAFKEQFALTNKAPTSSKSYPHFTLGGLRPESRDEIPLGGVLLSTNSSAIISCEPNWARAPINLRIKDSLSYI
jgi:hypothetical protein